MKLLNIKFAYGIPLIIFLSCFLITLTSKFSSNQELISNAIVIDLLITAPFIYYLAIRKSSISKLTVLRVFLAGVFFCGLILETRSNALLQFIKIRISPLIEILLITFIAGKFYTAGKKAKQNKMQTGDFLIYCRKLLTDLTGNERAGNIIASEAGVIYYAFFGRKFKITEKSSEFTSYKKNGILPVFGIILGLFVIETAAFHFLLLQWNTTAARIITALNLYTCLQLFAHIRAIKARPVRFGTDSLEIYNGLAGDALIKYDNIEKAEFTDKTPADRTAVKFALLRKLEKHNCVINLKQPADVTIIFGIKKKADAVMFYVDEVKEFSEALSCRLS